MLFPFASALDMYYQHRPKKPVVAVIYTHSHADHFGGVKGVVSEEDVKAKKVRIIAPEHFTEEAVSENVMAGTVMSRRATYMVGPLLPQYAQGQVSVLGMTGSSGLVTLILPTDIVTKTGQKLTIDGLTYEFLMAPGSDAPSEFPLLHSRTQGSLHRGKRLPHAAQHVYAARRQDARFTEMGRISHPDARNVGRPSGGAVRAAPLADVGQHGDRRSHHEVSRHVQYIHDQVLRLANHGYTMIEIGEMVKLPPSLEANWASHGYYGSVNHDAKSVYNFYLGFFNANPATLNELPPAEAAKRYVEPSWRPTRTATCGKLRTRPLSVSRSGSESPSDRHEEVSVMPPIWALRPKRP